MPPMRRTRSSRPELLGPFMASMLLGLVLGDQLFTRRLAKSMTASASVSPSVGGYFVNSFILRRRENLF